MRRIAQIIRVFRDKALKGEAGPKRQIFFVSLGSWDHHNGLASAHPEYLDILDSALGEFYMLLKNTPNPSGFNNGTALEDVTTFTASDFGRALVPNGDGSDHAWGGHHVVMGGAVNGGQIYGQYPKMLTQSDGTSNPDNLDIYGNGVMVPTLSVDQYMQRLAKWFLQNAGASWDINEPTSTAWNNILPNWSVLRGWNGSQLEALLAA
jgi:uncharacterized protein (DUF1501 family)